MALIPRLDQRQSQTLIMTPQLQQAIKLLQLSNLELLEFVEKELETNPLLERNESNQENPDDGIQKEETNLNSDHLEEIDALPDIDFNSPQSAEIDAELSLDAEEDNTYTNDSDIDISKPLGDIGSSQHSITNSNSNFEGFTPDLEQTLPNTVTLREHLSTQIRVALIDPKERLVAACLIDLIDETGYFLEDILNISNSLGCDGEIILSVLKKLQNLDPPGIFARNLSECLKLQLIDANRFDPYMEILLQNLPLLGRRNLSELAIICGVDKSELDEMLIEIKALNPKPGSIFDNHLSQPIVPDVLISEKSGGGWFIELNSETLPQVLVNNDYYSKISTQAKTKKDKLYITQQFQSASWLIKSLHQRATTTLKVVTELVKQQNEFFLKGVQHLKPLALHDIANVIEMHESTISRVTSNKYVATPRGIFELKYFFTTAIPSINGKRVYSAEAIRQKIKTLIDGEPHTKVLSDDKIVTNLGAEGIAIARRTIAKYRDSMNIPSSVERRRQKSPPT